MGHTGQAIAPSLVRQKTLGMAILGQLRNAFKGGMIGVRLSSSLASCNTWLDSTATSRLVVVSRYTPHEFESTFGFLA